MNRPLALLLTAKSPVDRAGYASCRLRPDELEGLLVLVGEGVEAVTQVGRALVAVDIQGGRLITKDRA